MIYFPILLFLELVLLFIFIIYLLVIFFFFFTILIRTTRRRLSSVNVVFIVIIIIDSFQIGTLANNYYYRTTPRVFLASLSLKLVCGADSRNTYLNVTNATFTGAKTTGYTQAIISRSRGRGVFHCSRDLRRCRYNIIYIFII